jgi:peptidoglycan/LPS O-acetylase OafA/YrhL
MGHEILLGAPPEIYDAKGIGVTVLTLGVSVGIAGLSWRYFEKPLVERGRQYSYWDGSLRGGA